jgi:hypothetical protein
MLKQVARIRIIDEWLRSPVSAPSRYRAIMVVAESWGEQRVLMRAFQNSPDQTRPTIVLHGAELAISPAGPTPHSEWGIHVEPPVDGRAQELRQQLEVAAQRLAGGRGKPARLMDENSQFEGKRTNYWAPGSPADRQSPPVAGPPPAAPAVYEPALVAPPQSSTYIPSAAPMPMPTPPPMAAAAPPMPARAAAPTPVPTSISAPPRRRRGWTSPIPNAPAREVGSRTQAGFAGAPTATQPRVPRRPDTVEPGKKLSKIVGRTMPVGFQLVQAERDVLNALGDHPYLTARQIGELVGDGRDPVAWMDCLMSKLAEHGLDLIMPGDDLSGEPTYVLRR